MEEVELLDILKYGLLNVCPLSSSEFGNKNKKLKNSIKAQNYYLLNLENNLYDRKRPNCKLGTGAEAVRSSASMIYNTIADGNLIINNLSYKATSPLYERPFKAIKDDKDSEHTAKLDASLISLDGNSLLLIEAKCMEWFDKKPKGLKKAYLNKDNYIYQEAADIFIPIFKNLIIGDLNGNEYTAKTERYDAVQMTIHTLGIYNYCLANENKPRKIQLLNVVWDVKSSAEYLEEEEEGNNYINSISNEFQNAFEKLGVTFDIKYIPYSDFLNSIDWTNNISRRRYLSRYDSKLHVGLNSNVNCYTGLISLCKLRETANKYSKKDPLIDRIQIKQKFEKIYNCMEEEIPSSILKDVYGDIPVEKWESDPINKDYMVSNLGRIRYKNLGKLIKQDDSNYDGYLKMTETSDGNIAKNVSTPVYRFIAETFYGDTTGKEIHHIDNNGYDNRPINIVPLTTRQHSKAHGYYMPSDNKRWEE